MNAKNEFSYVITGYKEELRRNPKARLATYCRNLGVNDDRVHHWMEKHSLTFRGLKDEALSSSKSIDNDFVPLLAEKLHRLAVLAEEDEDITAEDWMLKCVAYNLGQSVDAKVHSHISLTHIVPAAVL